MSLTSNVTVVGSLHLDIMVRAPDRPRKGETLMGSRWWFKSGGKGANQAIAAALHGGHVSMIGCLGEDSFAEILLTALKDAGVNSEHIARSRTDGSGMSVAIVDDTGDYGAVVVSGSNQSISDAMIADARALISNSQILLLQQETNDSANRYASRIAKAAGCKVILNAAPAKEYINPETVGVEADILVVNALEAEALGTGSVNNLASAESAAKTLAKKWPIAVVTAGAAGVAAADQNGVIGRESGKRIQVKGTHGAGDVFVGTLAVQLAQEMPISSALAYANNAAAEHCATDEKDPVQSTSHSMT